jgi:hypothetical protein
MLKLSAFEFIFRTLPEAFIFIFASYLFANQKINTKKYILSSIMVAISIFLIRMLPINYGVHTILNIITQTLILNSINKIDIIPAVKSALVTTICLFIIELLNMVALNIIYGNQLNEILSNPMLKTIYGLPSLAAFLIIVICYYYFKKGKNEYVKD